MFHLNLAAFTAAISIKVAKEANNKWTMFTMITTSICMGRVKMTAVFEHPLTSPSVLPPT